MHIYLQIFARKSTIEADHIKNTISAKLECGVTIVEGDLDYVGLPSAIAKVDDIDLTSDTSGILLRVAQAVSRACKVKLTRAQEIMNRLPEARIAIGWPALRECDRLSKENENREEVHA